MTAVLLAGLSALIHALWNLVGKRYSSGLDFYLMANISCVILLSPILFFCAELIPTIILGSPWLVFASILAQVVYMGLLSYAYKKGEMSLVYPIARTFPVPLIFLYEELYKSSSEKSWFYLLGVVLICVGMLMSCNLKGNHKGRTAIFWALIIGVAISCYSVLDHIILESTLKGTEISKISLCLVHMFILEVGLSIGMAVLVGCSSSTRENFRKNFRNNTSKSFLMGAGISSSYAVALLSMTYTHSTTLVVAIRQLSIPLGFLLGVFILQESSYRLKWIGMGSICAGLALVGSQ